MPWWGLPGIDPSPTSYFSFFLKHLDTNIWWTVPELLQMIKPPWQILSPWWPWVLRPIGVSGLIMLTLVTAPWFLTIKQSENFAWVITYPRAPFSHLASKNALLKLTREFGLSEHWLSQSLCSGALQSALHFPSPQPSVRTKSEFTNNFSIIWATREVWIKATSSQCSKSSDCTLCLPHLVWVFQASATISCHSNLFIFQYKLYSNYKKNIVELV